MAKYRCPTCGAAHKEQVAKCRMCGTDMSGTTEPVMPHQPTAAPFQSRGAMGLAVIGIVVAVALGVLFYVFGLAEGDRRIEQVTDRLPVLGAEGDDGWAVLTVPEGRYTVELPGAVVNESVPFSAVEGGVLDTWTAAVGDETLLWVGHGTIENLDEEASVRFLIEDLGQEWAESIGGKVDQQSEAKFAGNLATQVNQSRVEMGTSTGYARSFLFLRGDELYVVAAISIYPDTPQFNRVLQSLRLTS